MKALGLKYFTDTDITSFGLIIFFVFFMVMFIRTMSRDPQKKFEYLAQLPLEMPTELLTEGDQNVESRK